MPVSSLVLWSDFWGSNWKRICNIVVWGIKYEFTMVVLSSGARNNYYCISGDSFKNKFAFYGGDGGKINQQFWYILSKRNFGHDPRHKPVDMQSSPLPIIPTEKPSQPLLFLHPNTVKHFYNCADRCKSDVLLRHGLNQGFGITGSQ